MSQPTNRFRQILIPLMLLECLRGYYSVNSSGRVNWLYKYCAALLCPLVDPVADYQSDIVTDGLIANSKFQIGQVTNVLNYLYDNVLNRIFITQGYYMQTVDTTFAYAPINTDTTFASSPTIFEREFNDPLQFVGAIIHVPVSANLSALTATVAQMALAGIQYTIVTF
jgi:hypothetical protein